MMTFSSAAQGAQPPAMGDKAAQQGGGIAQKAIAQNATAQKTTIVSELKLKVQVKTRSIQQSVHPLAAAMLSYIGSSPRLGKAEKQSLTGLIAMVDEFAGKDKGKLMMQIAGLLQFLETTAGKSDEKSGTLSLLDNYWETRKTITLSQEVSVSLHSHAWMEQLTMEARSLSLASLGKNPVSALMQQGQQWMQHHAQVDGAIAVSTAEAAEAQLPKLPLQV